MKLCVRAVMLKKTGLTVYTFIMAETVFFCFSIA